MGLSELAQATFWGAVLIFAGLTFYFWFIAAPAEIVKGFGSLGFMIFIAWLGIKLHD